MTVPRDTDRTAFIRTCSLSLFVLSAVLPAVGDVIAVQGKPLTVGVQLVDFDDGQLHVQLPSGRIVKRPIEDIQYLRITGWDTFNQAERLHRDGKLRLAADQYEKLLSNKNDQAVTVRYDRRRLVQCRLLQAYNALGRFDRAVELYIDIVEEMPGCLESLRPRKLPTIDSTFLGPALQRMDEAITRHGNDEIGRSLTVWRETWPGVRPRESLSKPEVPNPATPHPVREDLARIREMIDAGQFDAAISRIQAMLTPLAGDLRAELYYWQGQALIRKHPEGDNEEASPDLRRAGLALMRVVIHYPDHPLAPECLYTAGELCRRTQRDQQAAELWSELVGNYPKATQWIDRARQSLAEVQTPTSRPAAGENPPHTETLGS